VSRGGPVRQPPQVPRLAGIPDGVRTFTVTGGTVTVDVEGGVLSLVSATPNAGFAIDKSESRSESGRGRVPR